jgi:hypothetical protein
MFIYQAMCVSVAAHVNPAHPALLAEMTPIEAAALAKAPVLETPMGSMWA